MGVHTFGHSGRCSTERNSKSRNMTDLEANCHFSTAMGPIWFCCTRTKGEVMQVP